MDVRTIFDNPITRKIGELFFPPSSPVSASDDEVAQRPENGDARSIPVFKEFKAMPGPWLSLPLYGTTWQYWRIGPYYNMDLYKSNEEKYRLYGPIMKEEYEWRKPVVQLFDPEDFDAVFKKQKGLPCRRIMEFVVDYRSKRPEKYDSPGLANALDEDWNKLRNILNPVLAHPRAIALVNSQMNSVMDDFSILLRASRDQETMVIEDFQNLAYRMALEGVYMMSLDTRLGCLNPDLTENAAATDMILSVQLLFEAFHELYYGRSLWQNNESESYRKLDRAESLMYEATSSKIQQIMEDLRRNPAGVEEGILRTLIKSEKLTEKEIIVSVIDLISGGIFTVANAFSFLVYHIATNQDVQDNLYEELNTVLGANPQVTKDCLANMRYLKACIQESFRLSPTIPCVNRILTQEMILSGYRVPAGTDVFCNFPVACMQPDTFPEPERFNPDRWLVPEDEKKLMSKALLPFGYGKRLCIGKALAENEMYMALAKLVYHFQLEYVGETLGYRAAFINVPANPISVILRDRIRD